MPPKREERFGRAVGGVIGGCYPSSEVAEKERDERRDRSLEGMVFVSRF